MAPLISLAMSYPVTRRVFLEDTLNKYAKECDLSDVELVLVEDQQSGAPLTKTEEVVPFKKYGFASIKKIVMDGSKSIIPATCFNSALGVNVAVKNASGQIIIKTDPECIPECDVCDYARRKGLSQTIWILGVDMEDSNGNAEPFIPERLIGPYWYCAIFRRDAFMAAGGVDENFMRGFAGEDDEWGERLIRRGHMMGIVQNRRVLHRWHGSRSDELRQSPHHLHNIELIKKSRDNNTMIANEGHDWGSDSCILNVENL